MAQVILSEEAYHLLIAAATERDMTLDEVIAAGIEALNEHDRQRAHPDRALTAEEFEAELGFTPEESAEAETEARKMYPDVFA